MKTKMTGIITVGVSTMSHISVSGSMDTSWRNISAFLGIKLLLTLTA